MYSKAYDPSNIFACTQLALLHVTEAHSFPPASLSENCLCFGTDNVHGKISVHIFAPNRGYCLHIPAKMYPNVIATPTLTNTPSFL